MSELSYLISSTPIEADVCPRAHLGLSCMVPDYACVCEHVERCDYSVVKNDEGRAAVIQLRIAHRGNPKPVMTALNATRYRADFEASLHNVIATFNLRRPENRELREYAIENGA